jgi:hypothetical protein
MTTSPTFIGATYSQLVATYGEGLVSTLDPWMIENPDIAIAFIEEMIEAGGTSNMQAGAIAIQTIRMDPQYRAMYDAAFPGNRREDGSLRLSESGYLSRVQGYRDVIMTVSPDMDPAVFEEEFGSLISGDVDTREFERRVESLNARVISNATAIRDFYAANFGINMTDAGILASLMSGRVSEAILNRQITMSEIAGEGVTSGFDISAEFADLLVSEGQMDRDMAQQFFGTAEAILPVLSALAQRHGDPDDDFDIMELAEAQVFLDAGQSKRIKQLVSQEEAMFTGGAQIEIARSQSGGLGGLEAV